MTFGGKTHDLLVANEAVRALVVGRVFPQVMPESVSLPAIAYTVISDTVEPVTNAKDPRAARVQVDCYAKRYDAAQSLSDAVRSALHKVREDRFTSLLSSRRDGYEDETGLYRVSMDFSQWMTEADNE